MAADGWLGLEPVGDGRYRFRVVKALSRFDHRLYGGGGLAATIAAMEAATGRATLWVTVQFVGVADLDQVVECHVEQLATGRSTSQVRVTATVDDAIILTALGATAAARPDGFSASFGAMPEVSPPDDSTPWLPEVPVPFGQIAEYGPFSACELRAARRPGAEEPAGFVPGVPREMLLWMRLRDQPLTRPAIAYLADFVPSAVVLAAGRLGASMSLDNSIRFGPPPPADDTWVLFDADPHLAHDGYVHGVGRIWAQDGTLLAVAGQTATVRLFG